MLQNFIAQQSDGGLIDKMREPGFQSWAVYAFIAFLIYDRVMKFVERKKARSVEVQQPLEVRQAREAADKGEVQEHVKAFTQEIRDLEQRLTKRLDDAMEIENARHLERMRAGEHRVSDLARIVDENAKRLEEKVEKVTEEMRLGRRMLHEKVNAAIVETTSNGAQLPHIKERLGQVERNLHEDIKGVHRRIDDCIKSGGGKK